MGGSEFAPAVQLFSCNVARGGQRELCRFVLPKGQFGTLSK